MDGWFASDHPLVYTVAAANDSVISARIGERQLILGEKGCGSVRLTLTADNQRGGTAQRVVHVRVARAADGGGLAAGLRGVAETLHLCDPRSQGTPPSLARTLRKLNLPAGFATHTLDLAEVFEDAEGRPLTYPVSPAGEANRALHLAEVFEDAAGKPLTYSVSLVSEAKGFQWAMTVFAVLSVLLFLTTFAGTRERVLPNVKQKTSLGKDLRDLGHNGPWLVLCVVGILTLTFASIHSGAILFFFKYAVGSGMLASLFFACGYLATLSGISMTKWYAKWWGNRNTFLISMGLGGLLAGTFYFISADQIVLLFALRIVEMFILAPTSPLLWAMYADAADYSEWRTGRRATGLVFSASSFSQKMGWVIGGAALAWLLAWFGFQANAEQTPEALGGIRLVFSLIPAGLAGLAAVSVLFYKLDEPTMRRIESELAERKSSTP